MKFERAIAEVSIFDVKDVVTTSSTCPSDCPDFCAMDTLLPEF